MKWGNPDALVWLWTLIPIAWVIFFLLRRRDRRLANLIDEHNIPILSAARLRRRAVTRSFVWLAALALLGIALARPQWGFRWQEVNRRGLDVMVVLDTSKSMLAEDIKPNRLQQAKWGISDLLRRLRGDRIGLVSFAGSAFLQCPLTIDYAAFLMTLNDVYVGIIPHGGTAIEKALLTAIDSFEERRDADRAILIITDGEDHEGDPLSLLPELQKQNIFVFAVGIGTTEGELIPTRDSKGRDGYLKDREGHVVKSSLQEDALERLAVGTGGTYVRSTAGDIGLERIVEQGIARLKRAESESKMVKEYEDRFPWFLVAALLALALEASVSERARLKKEQRS